MKYFKYFLLLLLILLIAFVVNVLVTTGFFRSIENKHNGKVLKEITLPGAEDITISRKDSFAIISSTKRLGFPMKEQEVGGLYFMDLKDGQYNVKPLTNDHPAAFAPHGISIFPSGNGYKVAVINHTLAGHSIELFHLENEVLSFEKTLTDELMISPNDLVLMDENRFYFTNDHGYPDGLWRHAEDYLGFAWSNVVYSDGKNYRVVAEDLTFANGINYDTKRNLLFVACPRSFDVSVYRPNPDGSLAFESCIPAGTGVDNIEFDQAGKLWIGCHPDLLAFTSYAKKQKTIAPSEVITINYQDKKNFKVASIFVDDGNLISATSVAAPFGNVVLIGNVKDDTFLVMEME